MEWIKCSERLPEIGQNVLCTRNIIENKEWFFGCCKYLEYGFPWVSMNNPNPIQYWMPIPLPPKEEQEEPC